ncbi:pyridoxamine 5'-phosphate oxidase family protein [Pararhizobium mangrovi]|uniref:General stress protein n=1 Tax=Pararhizobium mangrovi TaxID=2590452 RepID=A0A506UH94_9HYPH|nr:pyridoxamine 5'-phosphate oxidase family protein [Pararhizobium mangrovi]TPW32686.1 general stress protein [Pararhizobium mangrovi]
MADLKLAETEPEHQLWEEIDNIHAVMLGVEGKGAQQPMAPELDRETKTIWFFARKSSDLVQNVGGRGRGLVAVVGKSHDYHASLSGSLEERMDPEIRDRFWNAVIEAWFEHGKEDPDLTMLALKLDEGHVWASTNSTLKFGWQIAKANAGGGEPDVGISKQLRF